MIYTKPITEVLSDLTYTDIENLGRKQLTELLQKARRATSGRLATIEKRNYDPLVPNIEDLKSMPRLTSLTTQQMASELRRRKAFLKGSRGTATKIEAQLSKGYAEAQKRSGKLGGSLSMSPSTVTYDPTDVITTRNKKGNVVYRTKDGTSLKLRYTIDGKPVFVSYETQDAALMTGKQLRSTYKLFERIYQHPTIKAANLDSEEVRLLVYYAKKGYIYAEPSGKKLTTTDIAEHIVKVYDSYIQGTRDTKLADEAVYNALDDIQ